LVTGGGGVAGLVAFFGLVFLAGFFRFSTLPEPCDSALPGETVVLFFVGAFEPAGLVVVVFVVVVFVEVVVDVEVGFGFGAVDVEVEVEVEVV
jgi:hypothetical protein